MLALSSWYSHVHLHYYLQTSFLCLCCLNSKTLCWVLQVQYLLKLCSLLLGGEGSAGGALRSGRKCLGLGCRWLSILTSCVASDKGTNLWVRVFLCEILIQCLHYRMWNEKIAENAQKIGLVIRCVFPSLT